MTNSNVLFETDDVVVYVTVSPGRVRVLSVLRSNIAYISSSHYISRILIEMAQIIPICLFCEPFPKCTFYQGIFTAKASDTFLNKLNIIF